MADLRRAGAGVVGAVAAGALAAGGIAAARADQPVYPTWREVQRAKADAASAEAEVARIVGLVAGLQDRADSAGRTAMIAAEHFHRAKAAEDAARALHADLARRADAAQAGARTSRMRAGLLAASVARGGDPQLQLLLDAGSADGMLRRLATVSQLSAQTRAVYAAALMDEREAEAAGAQADAAAGVLATSADAARTALEEAQTAGAAAQEQVDAEQQHADRLIAQLADLRGTSVRLATAYVQEQRVAQQPRSPVPTSTPSVSTPAPTWSPAPTQSPSASPSTTAAPAPVRTSAAPAPRPTPTAVNPAPVEPSPTPSITAAPVADAGPPNTAQAAGAIAFARDQIGDAYRFGAAGPDSWDCSGLTMQAYASVGLAIGGHSATAQYRLASAEGRLAPIAEAQVGDLLFYSDGGGDMYHVALYSGGGMMIEAPYPGTKVREVPVRAADLVPLVARPTA